MSILRVSALALAAATVALLAGCSTTPTGPSVMVLPGGGKNFTQFTADDTECRAFASTRVSGSSAHSTSVRNAAIATAVGAIAGQLIGDSSKGLGVGAGVGLLASGISGADATPSTHTLQRSYDNGYVQCMYAKGNQVPIAGAVGGGLTSAPVVAQQPAAAPPAANVPPPPPPNAPPPSKYQ